jgi:hypothetical protein
MNLGVDERITSLRGAPAIASLDDAPAIAASHDDPDIATAGTQTFGRLRALVARGYQPDFARSDDSCLLLRHPQKRFKYRDMLLDSSGTVQWLHDHDYTMHFSRWEKKRFDGFLRSVPRASWWDRTRPYCERACAAALGAVVCYVLYLVSAAIFFANGYFGWG